MIKLLGKTLSKGIWLQVPTPLVISYYTLVSLSESNFLEIPKSANFIKLILCLDINMFSSFISL